MAISILHGTALLFKQKTNMQIYLFYLLPLVLHDNQLTKQI